LTSAGSWELNKDDFIKYLKGGLMGPEQKIDPSQMSEKDRQMMGLEQGQTPEESERIESPELAEVMAEYEARARANIEEAKKEGGERGSEQNIKYLESAMQGGLDRRKEQYEEAMSVADEVVGATSKANESGLFFEPGSWALKSGNRLKSGEHLTPLGQDVLRAIHSRIMTRDENNRPSSKILDVEGHQKKIVETIIETSKRELSSGRADQSTVSIINYRLVDASENVAPSSYRQQR
jgi:hypothetical protein